MNGFPNKKLIFSVCLVSCITFLLGPKVPTVVAESLELNEAPKFLKLQAKNTPIQLVPKKTDSKKRKVGHGAANQDQPIGYRPISPSGRVNTPVAVHNLKELDRDSIGLLDDSQGGLGADMWLGISRSFVTRLLALLPSRINSPIMRNLMKRLLLTEAVAPKNNKLEPALLPLRIGALFEIGDLESALALISLTSNRTSEEGLARIGIDGRLFGNDTAGACQLVQVHSDQFKGVYWQKAAAFCLAMAGKTAQANLISDVLAEKTNSLHPAFFSAMDKLSGAASPKIISLKSPSALMLSLMRSAGLILPEDVVEEATPSALRSISLSPNAPVKVRLAAGELARGLGVIGSKRLGEIYNAIDSDSTLITNPIKYLSENWGPTGRAILAQIVEKQEDTVERAKLIDGALKLAQKKGEWKITALAIVPYVETIKPTAELAWFSGTAARIFIATGNYKSARAWLESSKDRETKLSDRMDLYPLVTLITKDDVAKVQVVELRGWWKTQNVLGNRGLSKARTFFSLLNAMGVSIPSDLWAEVLDDGKPIKEIGPKATIRNALSQAAENGSRGATVAMTLIALGERGTLDQNLFAVEMSIKALRRIGLKQEARAIALETAVGAGL
ncbi:MAG: hypothetical protein CMM83_00500 [Rhodospirillales bacterium]|nr:hypothetical protein [Rhodospirillales bacterium]|tara:strand:- start:1749 stop:3599 length:1851 start_codon:yes stop_codon:yes gene_type:complete